MNTFKTNTVASLLTLAALYFSQPLQAAPIGDAEQFKEHKRTPMLLKTQVIRKLELTDSQVEQIKAIYTEAKTQTQSERTELKALKTKWHSLANEQPANIQELETIASKQADLKAKLKVKRLQTKLAVDAILTEQQKAKVDAWQERRKLRKSRGRHHRQQDSE